MDDNRGPTFREPTDEEAKNLALLFMGQNLSELSSIDKNVVGSSNHIKGLKLDPKKVLESISLPHTEKSSATELIAVAEDPVIPHTVFVNELPKQQHISLPNYSQANNPNQLEFDFDKCHYSVAIFDELKSINSKLDRILESVEFKKKIKE